MIRRLLLLAFVVGVALFGPLVEVSAQEPLDVRIREVELDEDGSTRVVVSVVGEQLDANLDPSVFRVTENGQAIGDLSVEPLLDSQIRPIAVQMVIDVSGSTAGEPLANARSAARVFVETVVPRGVQVGVVAFGQTADVRSGFTTDQAALFAAIDALEAEGETALYDAVVLATEQLARFDGQHNMVIFSDGGDTVSTSTLEQAAAALRDSQTPATTVALLTDEFDPTPLDVLARDSGGRSLAVTDAEQLGTTFGEVANQLASQYVLTYEGTLTEPADIEIAIDVGAANATGQDAVVVSNNRRPPPAHPEAVAVERPLIAVFGNPIGLYTGVGAAFVGLALLLGVALSAPFVGSAERSMRRGLRFYGRGGSADTSEGGVNVKRGMSASEMTRRVTGLIEAVPKPEGFEERLQAKLERAGWPMRASEFLLLEAASAIGLGVVGWALSGSWVVGVLGFAAGPAIPYVILAQRIGKRSERFLEQLPDTLQLLSGSLRAGYGFLQAIDTVVKEASEPAASEFSRVLTEARLGMPLEDALENMADRLGSDDFRWVVLAVNIQRQIGGNLAQLLETVANTLRDRAMVRRQVQTLSAEGRLSAIVLIALPFFLTIYMFFVNGPYMMLLFTRTMGIAMVVGALVLIVVGIFWMRKLIDIEV